MSRTSATEIPDMPHHEYASLFPMMPETEIQALAADMRENGQHEAIMTLDGEILDGRNRYRACQIVGMTPWLMAYQGEDPLGFVVSHNLCRRHLTESQRGMIASKLATMRQGERTDLPPMGERLGMTHQSRQEAADALKVGTSTVDRARRVQKNGAPELIKAVEDGSVRLRAAETLSALDADEQREVLSKGPEAAKEHAAKLRGGGPARPRLPSYQPSDAPEIWQQARITLDRILPEDKQRERVLREVIAYCNVRLKANK